MKAAAFAGVAAVTALLAVTPVLLGYGTPPAAAQAPAAAPAPSCQKEAERAPVARPVPSAQKTFGSERIWPMSTGAGVTVAVLDSGVDAGHEQVSGRNIGGGADFLRRSGGGTGRYDCDGHGTAVTSLIAARKVPDVGFQGLAYGVRVLPVVVSDQHDEGKNTAVTTSPERFAKAITWAVAHGADVIHVSVTYSSRHPAVERAVSDALARDVVVVASVGNGAIVPDKVPTHPGPVPYPAAYHGVIGVAAVDANSAPLKTSPWGPYVDLVAPGSGELAANRGGGHAGVTGSGYATAFVSASAALVRAKWPNLSAADVARQLFATASPAAGDRAAVGHGMVDPYRALTEGLSDEEPAKVAGASVGPPDAATVARMRQWETVGQVALAVAGVGIVLAFAMLATLTLLPKGFRRRWRPGRAPAFPPPKPDEDDLPPAPVKLFENLETD